MRFGEGLMRARGQLMFLIGLVLASGVVVWMNQKECVPVSEIETAPRFISVPPESARQAWSYFERNYDETTGLVNAAERSGWTTIGAMGDALTAAMAAHRLGLITGRDLYWRTARLLKTLAEVTPAESTSRFETATGTASGSAGAADVESLVRALELVAWSYPANAREATEALEQWRDVPRLPQAGPPHETRRHATLLVRAALARRGEEK